MLEPPSSRSGEVFQPFECITRWGGVLFVIRALDFTAKCCPHVISVHDRVNRMSQVRAPLGCAKVCSQP